MWRYYSKHGSDGPKVLRKYHARQVWVRTSMVEAKGVGNENIVAGAIECGKWYGRRDHGCSYKVGLENEDRFVGVVVNKQKGNGRDTLRKNNYIRQQGRAGEKKKFWLSSAVG